MGRQLRRVSKNASRRLRKTLDRYAVSNWRQAHKFRSLWLALFTSALSGAWIALPAFQYVLPPIRFAEMCVLLGLIIGVVRLVRQSNIDDD